jgi:hypothetical protein
MAKDTAPTPTAKEPNASLNPETKKPMPAASPPAPSSPSAVPAWTPANQVNAPASVVTAEEVDEDQRPEPADGGAKPYAFPQVKGDEARKQGKVKVEADAKKGQKLYRFLGRSHTGRDQDGNAVAYVEGDLVPLNEVQYEAFKDKFEDPEEGDQPRRRKKA